MKKKGFTLIELLAVIIVLGIIALIAVPVISNVINESKEKAAKVSAQVYVRAIEDKIAKDKLLGKTDFKDGKTYLISEDTSLIDLDTNLSEIDGETELDVDTSFYLKDVIKVKGNAPEDGYVTIENGKVADAAFVVKGMLVSGTAEEIKNGDVDPRKFSGGSNVSNIVINNKKEGLLGGESYQLDITVNTKDGEKPDRKTTYTSSNESVATISNDGTILAVNEGTTEIKVIVGKKEKSFILTVYNGSLLGYVGTIDESGIYEITINNVTYNLDVTVLEGDQTITSNTSYGRQDNCATGTATNQMAKRMAIVKVKGNYTVNSGVTVGPTYNATYGGPKGFMLYVTGKLTNNGTIDNSHGAYATGQNVYLWKNADGTYEKVNATGANGADAVNKSRVAGNAGKNGTGRQTGGGGSGAEGVATAVAGGASGTSYSGGVGSGGTYTNSSSSTTGSLVGGTGGNGTGGAGGTGNPGGTGNVAGTKGTGGLLIIYANEYINSGSVTAKGTAGAVGSTTGNGGSAPGGGGSSGGGSINIFTNQSTSINSLGVVVNDKYNNMKGNTSAAGGATGGGYWSGGAGGSGTVNIGEVRNGQYYDLKQIIQQDINAYKESITLTNDSILKALNDSNLSEGEYYYYLKANGQEYPIHLYVYDGDQNWSGTKTFGAASDCATGTTTDKMAKNMVVVKVNGNLTNTGTIRPYYNTTYGGPKGFTLFVTGQLTNTGTIDNSHGAYATGQNVYLWKNADESYEYVPATGANGADAVNKSRVAGNAGKNGTGRQTGGGGSGAEGVATAVAGGASGTSYSGGVGSGGTYTNNSSSTTGSLVGGTGGNGTGGAGGTGNPGGTGNVAGTKGTGGLLIIYANEYINSGSVTAKGTAGAVGSTTGNGGSAPGGGGSSGGGSINIFYQTSVTKGTNVSAAGGAAGGGYWSGGAGGKGTVTYKQISF